MDCPDDTTLQSLFEGSLDPSVHADLTDHLGECAACRSLVGDLARAPETDGAHARGETLGRYVILETVGSGAMGVVYAAYDSELHRKVALKFLRTEEGEGSSRAQRGRLLREAQALARLAHPNVITVHDVGTLEGEVFIAMEFVEGATLRAWLRAESRRQSLVVDVFRQAGEGLAAAHAAGLVHRDFKPDNVLVGADGRVRVTDFGLARSVAVTDPASGRAAPAIDAAAAVAGMSAVAGTPAYMAPEVAATGASDARADQFSYCVALFEALHGERPVIGESGQAMETTAGRGARAASRKSAPRWLRRILMRGLSVDPSARWPSMRALLQEIGRGPRISGARAAAALGVLIAAVFAAATLIGKTAPAVCTGASAAWGGAWDEARANALDASFRATGRANAPFVAAAVKRTLDDERARWIAMHKEACEATRVRGEQPESVLGLRMQCLEDRRREIAALASVLEHADGPIVDRAIGATAALPDLADCANTRALESPLPLPADPSLCARIDEISTKLAEASALDYAGEYARGLAIVDAARSSAHDIDYAPLLARLALVRGRLLDGAGDLANAEASLEEAAAEAQEGHEDGVVAEAWTRLVRVVGVKRARPAEGEVWARLAEAAIRRAGGDDEREATRLTHLSALRSRDSVDEALAFSERARSLYQKKHGPHFDFQMAQCDELTGDALFDMGRFDEAKLLFERVLATRERLFGPNHPSEWISLVNLGEAELALGHTDEALATFERARATGSIPIQGDAYVHHRVAEALRARGEISAALDEDRASLLLLRAPGEKDSFWTSWPLTGMGLDLLGLGRAKEAVDPLERAVALRGEGTAIAELGKSKFGLARALWEVNVDRKRAVELARSTRDALRADALQHHGDREVPIAEIERWLASR